MKKLVCVLIAAVALGGCRREDVRTVVIDLPTLAETNRAQVVAALAKYAGVRRDEIAWDFANKRIVVTYDSMQVAQTNLRMALEEKGLKVTYPEKTTDRAGY